MTDDIILHKLLTLEVIVETIIDELVENELIDIAEFDNSLISKINNLTELTKKPKDDFDYSTLFMGPKGEA